jgi:tetratricopeptide (TPR) repeat protein
LGALLALPALVLAVHGLAARERRGAMLATLAATLAAGVLAGSLARGLYAGGSPWGQLADGIQRVLTQPRDMQAASLFSWRRAGDVWSHIVQMGPLSIVPVALLTLVLGVPQRLRGVRGAFLLLAALGCYGPALLTGEGNLGAARNWDLFAGPSLAVAFAGLLLILETEGPTVRQRLLLAALAASLAQAGAWTALGMNTEATRARVAALPLGHGRGAAMLGTDDMNAGRDDAALQWFQRAIAEDSLNVNAWSGLGVVLARNGRYAEAEPALRRVVELKPTVAIYRQDLAVLYMREQRWAEAAGHWQSALFVDHTLSPAWLGLAEAMRQQGHADSAVYALTAAARARPGDAAIVGALADGYAFWVASAGQRGDVAEFARAWEGFTGRFPDDARVQEWRARAEALLARGRTLSP